MNALICKRCRHLLGDLESKQCRNCGASPTEVDVVPLDSLDPDKRAEALAIAARRPPPVPLRDGEHLLFRGSNPTFHRFGWHDYHVAFSDEALYLPNPLFYFRRRSPFQRVPLSEIESIDIVGLRKLAPWLINGTVAAAIAYLIFETKSAAWCKSIPLWMRLLIPGVAFLIFACLEVRSQVGRHSLVVATKGRLFRFNTPPDTYDDEKEFDLKILREALAACRAAGVTSA